MYDDLSVDYDRFVDWEDRLAAELPFIEQQMETAGTHRVLDAACGTGMHAIALAQKGYRVVGADLSAGMIEQARSNAAQAGADVRFEIAGFGELSVRAGEDFDALLCLGNSLPHVLTPERLAATLDDFAACLRPGGLLLIQNRNFDAVLSDRERWMAPQHHQEGKTEWLFLRFYDFDPDGLLTFNMMRLRRERNEDWRQQVASIQLWPQTQPALTGALEETSFGDIICFGDLQGNPFDPEQSPNLAVVARLSY